jgi:hypothetical protein
MFFGGARAEAQWSEVISAIDERTLPLRMKLSSATADQIGSKVLTDAAVWTECQALIHSLVELALKRSLRSPNKVDEIEAGGPTGRAGELVEMMYVRTSDFLRSVSEEGRISTFDDKIDFYGTLFFLERKITLRERVDRAVERLHVFVSHVHSYSSPERLPAYKMNERAWQTVEDVTNYWRESVHQRRLPSLSRSQIVRVGNEAANFNWR